MTSRVAAPARRAASSTSVIVCQVISSDRLGAGLDVAVMAGEVAAQADVDLDGADRQAVEGAAPSGSAMRRANSLGAVDGQ